MTHRSPERLRSGEGRVGVIGLGYVGLPLAVAVARAGLTAVGLDTDEGKTAAIRRGESYLPDLPAEDVRAAVGSGALTATTDFGALAHLDAVGICVPTPLKKTREPDLSHPLPDVVLEVDNTTDIRKNRLKPFEAWGFPEVWVAVPATYSRSRPRGLSTGLAIYLLDEGGYAPSKESLAFPG